MKLYEFLEQKPIEKNVRFEKVTTYDGRDAVSTITDDGKIYVIDASLKDFKMFKEWLKMKGSALAEIQKTYKSIKLNDGTKVPTIRINTEFEVRGK
jgi:hypothetical protein